MEQLNRLFYLKKEIENLKTEIKELSEICSPQITGMPKGTIVSNPVENAYFKKEKLVEKLNRKIAEYFDELDKIENFIETIEDIEIKSIARMRFILNLKFEEIGEAIHLHRSVCSRKLKKYVNENFIMEDSNEVHNV